MRNRSAATVCGVALAATVAVPTAGASAAPSIDPAIPNRQMWAQRYLDAICPANHAGDRATEVFRSLWGKRVPKGTPVPASMRKAYRADAKMTRRAGVALNRHVWPQQVRADVSRMTRFYFSRNAYARSRITAISGDGWKEPDDIYSSGQASTRIRIALGLPPRGTGCGAYS